MSESDSDITSFTLEDLTQIEAPDAADQQSESEQKLRNLTNPTSPTATLDFLGLSYEGRIEKP